MRISLLASATMLSVLATGGAQAQSQMSQGQASSSNASESTELGEVVVTAQHRSETVQRTPLNVTALSAELLERASVVQAQDLNRIAPGVQISQGGPSTQIYIRGAGTYGTNMYADPAVAFNVDGVYIGRLPATEGVFYDLERVEVLKGPQGTLYGRNATGGAVNILTARPRFEWGGGGSIEIGDYNLRRADAYLNIPLSDKVAVRIAGQSARRDGYLSDGYDDADVDAARLKLLYQPNDDVSLLLSTSYAQIDGKGPGAVPAPLVDSGDPWVGPSTAAANANLLANTGPPSFLIGTIGDDGYINNKFYSYGAELNWRLGSAALTVIANQTRQDADYVTYRPGFYFSADDHQVQNSLEARLAGESGRLKWVTGLYAYKEDQRTDFTVNQGAFNKNRVALDSLTDASYAAFGQGTFSLSPSLRLTAGLRYTQETKTQHGILAVGGVASSAVANATYCTAANQGVFTTTYVYERDTAATDTCIFPVAGDKTWRSTDWKLGFEYDLAPDSLLYGSVSTATKAGGFWAALEPNTYEPERLTAYAVGSKNRFFDRRLQVNLETYYWDYKDHQESHLGPIVNPPAGFTNITENSGKATIYGMDLDTQFKLTAQDLLSFNLQYLHAAYDEFRYTRSASLPAAITSCGVTFQASGDYTLDCSGKRMPRTPEWLANIGYEHRFDLPNGGSITPAVHTAWSAAYWLAIDYTPNERQASYWMSDFDIRYAAPGGKWSLAAYVHNIENTAVFTDAYLQPFTTGISYSVLRAPRTVGVRLSAKY
jgi:iron complex outermembrane receptor protein